MTLRMTVLSLGLAAQTALAAPATPTDIVGIWLWEDGASAVEFYRCGEVLCGRMVWIKDTPEVKAETLTDKHNPDPGLRNRPVCGLEFITGLKPAGTGEWEDGRIYSIGSGSSYDLDLNIDAPDHIKMRGYKSVRMFGQSFSLTRAPSDLPRCPSLQTGAAR